MSDSVAALPQDLQLKAKGKIFAIVSEVEAENIERNARAFLANAQNSGVPTQETFHCVDLWERQHLNYVVICLQSLGRKDGKPSIGPKEADKNVRNLSEEQLRAGQNVISLQYGSNKGANQSGINFGNTRHM
ncbi:myophilin-like [Eurosta solidaginis]|uniref:myophilin-like n=1 Tax=Eurosta solidaginis TaxID=178769 RepID=UPI0035305E1C